MLLVINGGKDGIFTFFIAGDFISITNLHKITNTKKLLQITN